MLMNMFLIPFWEAETLSFIHKYILGCNSAQCAAAFSKLVPEKLSCGAVAISTLYFESMSYSVWLDFCVSIYTFRPRVRSTLKYQHDLH